MTARAEAPAVWALALGQMLTYAGVYYGFPALLPELLASTGWSEAQLAAGPTLSFLITAALTPLTGRLVDRGLGGEMLVGLPLLAALCLAALGFAPSLGLWLMLWAVIGVAQAGMYYETCFAFLTRRLGEGARPAITRITLVAGLAGTLAFPLGHALGQAFGSAGALLVFAGLIVALAVPLNLFGVRRLRRIARASGVAEPPLAGPAPIRRAMGRWPFWALTGIYGALWLNHGILLTFVLLLYAGQGADPATATLAAACIGPAQVGGRLVLMLFEARIGNAAALVTSLAATAAAALVLIFAGLWPGLIFAVSLLQGAGIGVLSILRPVLIAQKLGREGFGAVSGAIAVAPILATAIGPSAGAALLSAGGAGAVQGTILALAVLGGGFGMWLARGPARTEAGGRGGGP